MSELTNNRPEITIDQIEVGKSVYRPDFSDSSGIEEIKVSKVNYFKIIKDIFSGDDVLEEVDSLNDMQYFTISSGNYDISKYDVFSCKKECQKYMLTQVEDAILDHQLMIDRFKNEQEFFKKIKKNILDSLS